MNDDDVDRYRIRELNAWDHEYQVIPWVHLPEEARNNWRHRANGGQG